MLRTALAVSLLSCSALAAGKPCTPPEPTKRVPVKLAAGTPVRAVLEWYQQTTCTKLEAPEADSKALTTLAFSGTVPAAEADHVVELALASADVSFRVSRAKAEAACVSIAEGITTRPDGSLAVKRAAFDSAFTSDGCLMRTVRVVPAFVDGKPLGFKLFGIRAGSVPERLGFRNGDVVKSVNGQPFDSPERALEAYSKLKEAKRLDLEIERHGATMKHTIHVD